MADSIFPDGLKILVSHLLLPPQSCPVMASPLSGHGEEAVPKWAQSLIESQKELTSQLSAFVVATSGTSSNVSESQVPVHNSVPSNVSNVSKRKPSLPRDDDSDDFDARFGHLFEQGVCDDSDVLDFQDDDENVDEQDVDYEEEGEDKSEEDDDKTRDVTEEGSSEDEDLVESRVKTPNWKVSSALKKFIGGVIDRPLPEEVQKKLDGEFVPSEELEQYFAAPKMPLRLYKAISRLANKSAIKTERALYASQTEAFVLSKPLLAALLELKPLGKQVSNARRMISKSIHGLYSISLKISKARREIVRFLFKEPLADVLYSYEPNHVSLFGGTDFASQVEKAAKVAKLDISWAKRPRSTQTFRSRGSQGFRGSRGGYNKYPTRGRNYDRRQGSSQSKRGGRGKGTPKKSQE